MIVGVGVMALLARRCERLRGATPVIAVAGRGVITPRLARRVERLNRVLEALDELEALEELDALEELEELEEYI